MNRRQSSVAIVFYLALDATRRAIAAENEEARVNPLEQPRYKQNPIYLLFESFVLDTIGYLPRERSIGIQSMNLQKVFKTTAVEWHAVLRETLHMSETIDIAILDLWYRNQDIAGAKGITYSPEQFAVNFTDEYMKEGSQVDVWPPGALEAAKRRIAAHSPKVRH